MPDLKLIALDAEDLSVVSAHLQDAVLRVADMAYVKGERRFAAVANRFDWAEAAIKGTTLARRRAGLRFERVLGAQIFNIDLNEKERVLSLLAIRFEAKDEPEGLVMLDFSGGAGVRLHVECIEAELKDLGAAWRARAKPEHGEATSAPTKRKTSSETDGAA